MAEDLPALHVRSSIPASTAEDHCRCRCCYKLVREKFKWFGLQTRVESLIMTQEERLFRNMHRQLFCWMDEWYGMTMENIRELEAKTAKELVDELATGPTKGMRTED